MAFVLRSCVKPMSVKYGSFALPRDASAGQKIKNVQVLSITGEASLAVARIDLRRDGAIFAPGHGNLGGLTLRFTKVIVAASVVALVIASGVETASAKSHDQNMAKFENDGNCALHFIVRRGNTNAEYRFILDAGQMMHLQLPNWSTYASQCDGWPASPAFSSVQFE